MYTSQETHPAEPALIDIPLLWRRKGLLAVSTLLFIVVGGVYVWKSDPMHQVGARVLVEKQGTLLNQSIKADHDKDFLPTQAEIIRSPAVIRRVAETLAPPGNMPDATPAIVSILERLEVDPLVGTDVLSVRFIDKDPGRGIVTVNAILAAYREYLRDHEREAHRETLNLLTCRERELRDDVKSLYSQYQQLHQESPSIGQGRDAAGVQKAILADMGKTLTAARNRRLELENHMQAMVEGEGDALANDSAEGIRLVHATANAPSVPQSLATVFTTTPTPLFDKRWNRTLDVLSGMSRDGWIGVEDPAPLMKAYLTAREQELELSALYGPLHPQIRAIRPRLAELEARLEAVVDNAPAMLQRQRQAVLLQEKTLLEMYEQEYEQAKTADNYAIEELRIQEELVKVQTLHDSILTEIRQWELIDQAAAEGRLGVSVRVLDEPAVTQRPLSASPKLVLAMCGLFGMLGGVFFVAVSERSKPPSSTATA